MQRIIPFILLISLLSITACKKEVNSPIPKASFSYSIDGYNVYFKSKSTDATSIEWNFGDGATGSGDSITHIYSDGGSYTVTLKASNAEGSNSYSEAITIGKENIIEIKTSFGDMYMWLYNETPLHKANFLKLSDEDFFDGTTFHRIIKGFVIQGGDPNSKDSDPYNDGTGGPGYDIPAEIRSNLKHIYGAVGAARLPDNVNPERKSNGSQFYISINKSGLTSLDGKYTVFGLIIKGMDVAETIANQPKNSADRPLTNINMDVNIIEKTKKEIKDEFGYEVN